MILNKTRKNTGKEEALSRAMRYCAYQERCNRDVENKLSEWGVAKEYIRWIIQRLKDESFIDDKRFAKNYASSKLNFNHWGRKKIRFGLVNKGIEKHLVDEAINSLDETIYKETLKRLAFDKAGYTGINNYDQIVKLKRFLLQRGFEYDEIETVIKEIKKEL